MRGLLAGVVALFGIFLALGAYSFGGENSEPVASQNADAGMTADSGTYGSGY